MDKTLASNRKKGSKKPKNKQPLKVVYITNPIKFNATASEFRSLVQELTGQDADYTRFGAAEQEVVAKVAEGNANAADLSNSASYGDDACRSPVMIDNFEGLAVSSLWHGDVHADVFKTLGAM